MNHADTLGRARQQLQSILVATSHGAAEIAYDSASGWFGALLAEQLIDPVHHSVLVEELKAAQARCDKRLRAAEAASRVAHQHVPESEL